MLQTGLCRAIRRAACAFAALCIAWCLEGRAAGERPNILWLTAEDHGPHLGCYGDAFAATPNLDGLAAKGMRFARVWSCAPVCAPARTAIITGMYPTSLGAEHMRSLLALPQGVKLYPQLLREAGYYCTNNVKEDYNVIPYGKVWDESSNKAHYKNRQPGQPFFAIFNYTVTHESQLRKKPRILRKDPSRVPVPPYHPDTPEVRGDWTQYYDNLSAVDELAGKALAELAEAGLAEETIVFYYSDHGSGMPFCKRWPYNRGLHVPLIVYFPQKWRHLAPAGYAAGATSPRLVSFVDLAPTVLSLAGIEPPSYMQGTAFAGTFAAEAPTHLFGFRGRMDERTDLVRSVTDGRYVYIRNYLPHLPYGQHLQYMWETPTTPVWERLFHEGKLNAAQAKFWKPKPAEELYDLQNDPHEVHDLAESPVHQGVLERLRRALREHGARSLDLGFLPEAEMRRQAGTISPYDWARRDGNYDFPTVAAAAELASQPGPAAVAPWRDQLDHQAAAVRYWTVLALQMRGHSCVREHVAALRKLLQDESPSVRLAAAETLGLFGGDNDAKAAFETAGEAIAQNPHDCFVLLAALNVLERQGSRLNLAPRAADAVRAIPLENSQWEARGNYGIARLKPRVLALFSKN